MKGDNSLDKIACSEMICIINQLDERSISAIPKKVIDFFENNKEENYTCDISLDIPLEEQNLREDTIGFLCMINYEYLADDDEKKILYEKYSNIDKEVQKDYDIYEIFKKRQENMKQKETKTDNQLIVYEKENIVKRIINKFLRFLKGK